MGTEPAAPPLERTVAGVRAARERWREQGRSVALVPTMGSLHEGHLSLVDLARDRSDRVVVSIFVNPTQFGPGEDFEAYPRDLERDLRACARRGVDLVFAPETGEMYPVEPTIWVEPGPLADRLCGPSRPGHFRGVLTVVAKLFGILEPGLAVFGRKDYQQAVLIRRMVEELRLPTRIELGPIVREPDGLALSSRNDYLSAEERETALSLSRALRRVRDDFAEGERDPGALRDLARRTVGAAGGRVEYVEIVDPDGLEAVERPRPHDICALAAHVGSTRLIDNASLGGPSSLDETGSDGAPAGDRERGSRRPIRRPSDAETGLHPTIRAAGEGRLPEWASVDAARRAHLDRVAGLMGEWAGTLGLPPGQVLRWRAAGLLHDALKDVDPDELRRPAEIDWPPPLLHGPAVAARLRDEGVEDAELLLALSHHSVGHPSFGALGEFLYVADFLDPGRSFSRARREALRSRLPAAREEVIVEAVALKLSYLFAERHAVLPVSLEFWNRLVDGGGG